MIIQHQSEQNRFSATKDEGECGHLLYRFEEDKRINFYSTYVEHECRNQGVARKLVRAGLAWANEEEFSIEASCSYVQIFLK